MMLDPLTYQYSADKGTRAGERIRAYDKHVQKTLHPQQQQQQVVTGGIDEYIPPQYLDRFTEIRNLDASDEYKFMLAKDVYMDYARNLPRDYSTRKAAERMIKDYIAPPYDELHEKIGGSLQHTSIGMLARGSLPEYQPRDNLGDQLLHTATVGAGELPVYAGAGLAGSVTGPAAPAVTFGLPPALNSIIRSHYTPSSTGEGSLLSEHTGEALWQAGKEGLLGAGMGYAAGLGSRLGRNVLPGLAGKVGASQGAQKAIGRYAGFPSEMASITAYEQATHPLYFSDQENVPERSAGESLLHGIVGSIVPIAGAKAGRYLGNTLRGRQRPPAPKPERLYMDEPMKAQNEMFIASKELMGENAPRSAREMQYKLLNELDTRTGTPKREGRTPSFDVEALYREGMSAKDDRTAFMSAMGNARRLLGEQKYKEITEGLKSNEIPRENRLDILNRMEDAMSEKIQRERYPSMEKTKFRKGTLDKQRDEVVSDVVFGVMKGEGMSDRIIRSDKGKAYIESIKNNEQPLVVFRAKKKNINGYEIVTTDSELRLPRGGGKYGKSKEAMPIEAYADELIPVYSSKGYARGRKVVENELGELVYEKSREPVKHTEFIYKPRELKEVSTKADLETGNIVAKAKQQQTMRTIKGFVEDSVFSRHDISPKLRTNATDLVKRLYPESDQFLHGESRGRRIRNGQEVEFKHDVLLEKPVAHELSLLRDPYEAGLASKAIGKIFSVDPDNVKMGFEQFQNWYRVIEMISGGRWTLTKEIFVEAPRAALDNITRETTHARNVIKEYIDMAPHKDSADAITYNMLRKSKDGVEALENMGIRPEQVRALDASEVAIMESIQAQYKNLFRRYNKARITAGLEPIREKAEYVTFFKKLDHIAENTGLSPVRIKTERQINALSPKYVERGAIPAEIETNIFKIAEKYTSDVLRYVHMEPVIKRTSDILNVEKINGQDFSLRAQAPNAFKLLTDYVNWLSSGRNFADTTQQAKTANKIVDTFSNNLTASMLMYSIPTVLSQTTAITQAVPHIGAKWVMTGMRKMVSEVLPKMNTEDNPVNLSREMGSRKQYADDANFASMVQRNLGRDAKTSIGEAHQKFIRGGFWAMQNLDYVVARTVWEGAYQKAKHTMTKVNKQPFDPEAAARYADDIVARTQASAMKTDLSPIQKTSTGRALTLFQTFVTANWNMIRELAGGTSSMTYSAGQKMATGLVLAMTYSSWNLLYENMLGIESPMPAPIHTYHRYKEEGKDSHIAALRAVAEFGKLVPIVGGGIRFGSGFLGPVPSSLHSVSQGFSNPERFWEMGAWSALKLLGGLPTSQTKRVVDAIQDDLGLREALVGRREFSQKEGPTPYGELPYSDMPYSDRTY
jgi:hypothetical protein